jgi:hypothetical protein
VDPLGIGFALFCLPTQLSRLPIRSELERLALLIETRKLLLTVCRRKRTTTCGRQQTVAKKVGSHFYGKNQSDIRVVHWEPLMIRFVAAHFPSEEIEFRIKANVEFQWCPEEKETGHRIGCRSYGVNIEICK